MAKQPPPQGFMGLPDLGDIFGAVVPGLVEQVTGLIPGPIGDAIQDTVGTILDPNDDSINIGDPQPEEGGRPIPVIPVKPGTEEMSATVKALNAAIGALDLVLKLSFMIPDQYEKPLQMLSGALKTIRGWLD